MIGKHNFQSVVNRIARDDMLHQVLGTYNLSNTEIEILVTELGKIKSKDLFVTSIVQHEMYHHFQCIGTSFGIAQWADLLFRGALLVKLINISRDLPNEQIHIPFREWGSITNVKEIYDTINELGILNSVHSQLFSGSPNVNSEKLKPAMIEVLIQIFGEPNTTIHPIIEIGENIRFHLGSMAVLEGAAWLTQLTGLLHSLGKDSYETEVLYRSSPLVYTIGVQLASYLWGNRFTSILYLLVSDLALWGPIGSCYENKERYLWEDIHPGWRFQRVAQLLSNWSDIPSDKELIDKNIYWAFVERICKDNSLNWETPHELASKCLRLTKDKSMDNIMDDFHVEACKLRMDYPLDLFLPFMSFEAVNRVFQSCPPLLIDYRDYQTKPKTWVAEVYKILESNRAYSEAYQIIKSELKPMIVSSTIINNLFNGETIVCPSTIFNDCSIAL